MAQDASVVAGQLRPFLAEVVRAAPVGLFYADAAGGCLFANEHVLSLAGLQPEAVKGMGWAEAVHPDDRERVVAGWLDAATQRKTYRGEYRLVAPDGVARWVLTEVVPVCDAAAGQGGFVGVVQEISAQRQAAQALRVSEERFRTICEHAPVMIDSFDESGACLLWNHECTSRLGYTQDEMAAVDDPLSLFYPDTAVRDDVLEAIRASDGRFREYEVHAKDGSLHTQIWANFRLPSGTVIAVGHDITERKQAERAVRASEETFRRTFESSAVGMVLGGRDGRVFQVNRAFCEMLGYAESELLDRHPSELTHPEDRPRTAEMIERLLRGDVEGDAFVMEKRYQHKDGGVVWGSTTVTLVRDGSGDPHHTVVQVYDITEGRAAASALQRSEQRFREMADHIREVFWLYDTGERRIIYVSPAYRSIWGRPVEALYADYGEWQRAIHPDDARWAAHSFARILQTGEGTRRAYRIVRPGGEVRWISDRSFVIRSDAGNVVRVAGVAEDITERKREEEEHRRFETKLQHAQKLESLGVLAGGIAHDFNNLLMGVLGNADLAVMVLGVESPARVYLKKIESAARRAAELTNQMLAYSGKGHFVMAPTDLNEVVQEISHLLQTVISRKANLRLQLAVGIPAIEADVSQLQQVIMNLLTNASDAIGETIGEIEVCTGVVEADPAYLSQTHLDQNLEPGRYVYLQVKDTGRGMDEQTLAKIFDPFFTTKMTGRGLGLATVQGIIRGHRGTIKVDTDTDSGTTFRVLFPPCEAECQQRAEQAAGQLLEYRGQEGATILLVDDDAVVLDVAATMLRTGGFRVITATDGRDGVERYRQHRDEVAAVVLDMTMPHLDGEEVFQELRRIRPDVRVLLSSGYAEKEATHRFGGKGLAGFIQKPYRSAALLSKVRQALGSA